MNVQWEMPPKGSIKINTNGIAKGNPTNIGIRIVCKDHNWIILHWELEGIGHVINNEVENLVIKHGSLSIVRQSFMKIIFELVYQNLMRVLDSMMKSGIQLRRLRVLATKNKELWWEFDDAILTYASRPLNAMTNFLTKIDTQNEVGC